MNEKKPKREISAGFIVYRRTIEGPKFLILYHGHNYWNFPKGKIESSPAKILVHPPKFSGTENLGGQGKTSAGGETSLRAAFRETKEETGLGEGDLRMLQNFKAYQKYFFRHAGQPIFKIVIYYLAETRNPLIKISRDHQGYAWFSYPEAMRILQRYRANQKILKQAYDFIHHTGARRREEHSSR